MKITLFHSKDGKPSVPIGYFEIPGLEKDIGFYMKNGGIRGVKTLKECFLITDEEAAEKVKQINESSLVDEYEFEKRKGTPDRTFWKQTGVDYSDIMKRIVH